MMRYEGLIPGDFRTPPIGGESDVQTGETRLSIDHQQVITIHSPLWEDPYTIGDGKTFTDPRADKFLQVLTLHQFHHFTTRQLSLVEEFETRPGSSRFVRLGHMLDSAKLLQDLGATFEQQVQTVISDLAHPTGSHLRGDFMVGDYETQDTHDGDLWKYMERSGFVKALVDENLLEPDGRLVGSHVFLEDLADPRAPRHQDLVECERPDNNADRAQFTLHEGVLVHDPSEVREAVNSIIRVETPNGERMAMADPEAARLLYKLAVRHQSEDWAEPLHRLLEELVLLPDRYLFSRPSLAAEFQRFQDYYPVDYTRTDEGSWHGDVAELGMADPFIPNVLHIARDVAAHQRLVLRDCVGNDQAYTGPVSPRGVRVTKGSHRRKSLISIHTTESTHELWVALPKPKYRGPIDSLVVTRSGLKRISEIDPGLEEYAQERKKWIVPLLAKIAVPKSVAKELSHGIRQVNRYWSTTKATERYPHPASREPMPGSILKEQIDAARLKTFSEARI